MYKYLSKKHMENRIPNNQKTCTSEGLNAEEEENGNDEEHRDVDYHNDKNRTLSSFRNIHVPTTTLMTMMTTGIQSRWWQLGFRIIWGFGVFNSLEKEN